jgi:hypothetical protein
MVQRLEAEFEGDAAEDQADEHEDQGQVERAEDDGVGQREGRQQAGPAQHQPGLVAVPHGRHRVHDDVALILVLEEGI